MRVLFIAVLILLVGFWSLNHTDPQNEVGTNPTPIESNKKTAKEIEVSGFVWAYDIMLVDKPENASLAANYRQKMNSEQLMENNNCQAGVNAGFYQEDFSPVGGVVIEGETVRAHSKNSLFNGYMGLGKENARIDYGWDEDLTSSVQTGPILIHEGKVVKLSLARDKEARRMVGATSDTGGIVFLTVFHPDAVLDGPFLEQLPEVVQKIGQKENVQIFAAINLDGGAASAWYSPTLTLQEWQPVGSWWCVS